MNESSAIQSTAPRHRSIIFPLRLTLERINLAKLIPVTGRVTLAKAEGDGGLHAQLVDPDGDSPVNVVAQVPLGPKWRDLRKQVFSWGKHAPPFVERDLLDEQSGGWLF